MTIANKDVQQVRCWLQRARRVTVLTGAGISAESGVPTFRGQDGLWRGYRATDLATPEAFDRDPQLVWAFYHWRRQLLAALEPNAAHHALVLVESKKEQFSLITQNIDDLHRRAGSSNILELHGNIWQIRCTACSVVRWNRELTLPPLPICRDCGALLRPHVVWFGEPLEAAILESAIAACRSCDLMLVIGTSAVVQPAASLALVAQEHGARIVEINLEATPYTDRFDCCLRGKAGTLVPELVRDL
ncbi:MAG: NAD-dependent deacylase [Deltaproteobacteria bacterium]|nr:NAD-dependent deacylase [Deltaproteobacteria bacterium]MBW2071620.1 NAD-dependent deacylase [Deltaproteobacteria bacterium]